MGRKKNDTREGGLDEAAVLRVFKQSRKPLHTGEILRLLKGDRRDKHDMKDLIERLIEDGKVLRLRGGAFGLVEHLKLVTGRLEIQRSGVGFVIPDDKARQDIFVSPSHMGKAWHGDRVAVALLPEQTGKRPEGRVARVIERGMTRLTVRAAKKMGQALFVCLPTDPKQRMAFMVDFGAFGQRVTLQDIVVVEPGDQIERDLWSAKPLELLGGESEVAVQEAVVKINHDIPTKFPEAVVREAEGFPPHPSEADCAGREDLRKLPFVTIDGAKARDFDDAILVTEERGGFRLRVAIADVSHYVRPGSALDMEARARGNSYYFPLSVEPMFPEALSNGLCSLNPGVDRLVMVAEMFYRTDGTIGEGPGDARFYAAVFRSAARLTYGQVHRALFEDNAEDQARMAHVLPMLRTAERLARAINARRKERGSLDFDLPEPEIMFNLMGETMDIRPKARTFAHQLIEEFMIAANEAVARYLTERELPCMYRVHPQPDPEKLVGLFRVLQRTDIGAAVGDMPTAKTLQTVIQAAQGTDLEFMVNRLALRTMMQASYTPIHEGHYGLASECYCHFTSPIRRYADLVVHRALKLGLGVPGATGAGLKGLTGLGDEISALERRGMVAEREILKRVTVLFLHTKVGDEFTGVVSSLADFGFWVELTEVMAEGLVRLSTLDDDYYALLPERQEIVGERTARRFFMGQRVRVRLVEVNLTRLEVNLEIMDEAKGRGKAVPERRARRTTPPPAARGRRAASGGNRDGAPKKAKGAPGKGKTAPDKGKTAPDKGKAKDARDKGKTKAAPAKGKSKAAPAKAKEAPGKGKSKA
ncbi:MAG: ribonuclease R [Desulfovibrionaceae bacterium]